MDIKDMTELESNVLELIKIQKDLKALETLFKAKKEVVEKLLEEAGERKVIVDGQGQTYTSVSNGWSIPTDLKIDIGLDVFPLDEIKAAIKVAETNFKEVNEPDKHITKMTVKVDENIKKEPLEEVEA